MSPYYGRYDPLIFTYRHLVPHLDFGLLNIIITTYYFKLILIVEFIILCENV